MNLQHLSTNHEGVFLYSRNEREREIAEWMKLNMEGRLNI